MVPRPMLALLRLVSLRHLLGAPLRTALTIAGVAIGVATVVGIAAINRSVMDAFRSTIDTIAGKADLTIGGHPFEEELVAKVRAVPGVTHAAGTLTRTCAVPAFPGERLLILGMNLTDDGYFRDYKGVDREVGSLTNDLEFMNSTNRLMLSEAFAKRHALAPGSTLKLQLDSGPEDFVVHGLLKETGPIKAFGGSVAVMDYMSAQAAFGRGTTLDAIDLAADPKVGWETVKERVQAVVGPTLEVDRPSRRGQSVETMVRSFQLGLNLGSAVALLVGVFLIYNTVSISVVQRRREIGALRALGATKLSIRWLFTLEALLLGSLGSALGIPLGVAIGRVAIAQVSASISSIYVQVNATDVQAGPVEIVAGLSLGVLGSIFAALRPAIVASGVQPVDALRRDVAAGAGAVQLHSWPTYLGLALIGLAWPVTALPPPVENFPLGGYFGIFLILMGVTLLSPLLLRALNRPFQRPGEVLLGVPGRLAADNFSRAPVRTAVPVSAMAVGVSMAVTVASFIGSFQASAYKWIDQAVPADLVVTSGAKLAGVQNTPMSPELGGKLKDVEGVAEIDEVRLFQHDVLGLRVYLISLTPEVYDKHGKPIMKEGALPDAAQRQQGYVVVSENFARRRNLKAGSTFPVKTPTGVYTYTVGAVIYDYTSDQGSIIIERAIFTRQFADDKVDSFHVYVKDLGQLEQVRARITEKYGAQWDLYVLSNAELHTEALSLVDNAFAVTHAMELVAVLLALLGVINTLLAAVIDRTREIGLLRAVGAARSHVIRLIAAEAAFIGLTGGALGVMLGGLIGFIVTKVVGVQSTGWNFPFQYPWVTGLQMLVAATVCAVLAGLYPARRAASIDVVEALAYE